MNLIPPQENTTWVPGSPLPSDGKHDTLDWDPTNERFTGSKMEIHLQQKIYLML